MARNKFSKDSINKIESVLRLHSNYTGKSSGGEYLRQMDRLTVNYAGPRGIALSAMLEDYYKQVGVNNLYQALNRLRDAESNSQINED